MLALTAIPPEFAAIALLVVSGVLVVAGVAKLRDQHQTILSFQALGVPNRVVAPLSVLVPIVELGLGVAIWIPALRTAAALAAALLFAAFTVIVARVVLQGRHVRCGCFGDLGRSQLTWWTVGRNVGLLALAGLVAVDTAGTGAISDAATRDGVTIGLTVAVVVLAIALLVTLRLTLDLVHRYGEALEKLDPTPAAVVRLVAGDAAPDAAISELDGPATRLSELWAGQPALLVFADPACGACRLVIPEVAAWSAQHPDVVTAVVSPRSWRKANQEHADRPIRWLLDRDLVAFDAFRPPRTPTAYLIEADGTLSADPAVGNPAIRALVGLAGAPPLAEYEVVDNEAATHTVHELLPDGGDVVFWNPGCRYCAHLRDELTALDPPVAASGRPVLVISAGRLDEQWQLPWPMVTDPAGQSLFSARAPGTPSIVSIAADGTLGEPEVGVDAVRDLLLAGQPVGAR